MRINAPWKHLMQSHGDFHAFSSPAKSTRQEAPETACFLSDKYQAVFCLDHSDASRQVQGFAFFSGAHKNVEVLPVPESQFFDICPRSLKSLAYDFPLERLGLQQEIAKQDIIGVFSRPYEISPSMLFFFDEFVILSQRIRQIRQRPFDARVIFFKVRQNFVSDRI